MIAMTPKDGCIHSMIEVTVLHAPLGNLHMPREHHPALRADLVETFPMPLNYTLDRGSSRETVPDAPLPDATGQGNYGLA